jgi:cytochrome c oxidase cbb3-type subunit III
MPRSNLIPAATLVLVALCSPGTFSARLQAKPDQGKGSSRPDTRPGERTFTASCAGCHGLDGRGGERAPNITGSAKLRRLSDADLAAIVSGGVPGTGMPAFRSLGVAEVHAVVSYLRFLEGEDKTKGLPGDPTRGKAVFFAKAECSSCHMVQGQGGFLGSDLSSYASTRSAKEVLDDIISPAKNADASRQAVTAVMRDGRRISGVVRNEDNFSVQLLTPEGTFYFILRSELQSLEYQSRPVMPADYGQRLTSSELNDLASYLMSVGRTVKTAPALREEN